jgi:hypothetical protein
MVAGPEPKWKLRLPRIVVVWAGLWCYRPVVSMLGVQGPPFMRKLFKRNDMFDPTGS